MLRENRRYMDIVEDCRSRVDGLERLKEKRVLVTGATGLIGSHLVDVLLRAQEVEVTACGRNLGRIADRFGEERDRLRFLGWDILSPLPENLPSYDYIVHAASGAHPAAFAIDPVGVLEANFLGARHILHTLRMQGKGRLLLVSSGEVYGQGGSETEAFDESYRGMVDSTDPRSCYPMSKLAAETLCAAFLAQYGVDSVIVRPCHVYGPTQTSEDSRASAQFIRLAAVRQDIVMKSDGAQIRGYCHVSDCVRGMLACMTRGRAGEVYNIADREGTVSIRRLAELCAAAGGVKVRMERMERPEQKEKAGYSKVTRAVLNAAKLEGIGWRAALPLTEGIATAVEILREM